MSPPVLLVSVVFASGADVTSWRLSASPHEARQLSSALSWLQEFGHLAAFGISGAREATVGDILEALRKRCGSIAADTAFGMEEASTLAPPAYLMPVWPFSSEIDGEMIASASFLGCDLDARAVRQVDLERGCRIPGLAGAWDISVGPLPTELP